MAKQKTIIKSDSFWNGYNSPHLHFHQNPYVPSEGEYDFGQWEEGWLARYYQETITND